MTNNYQKIAGRYRRIGKLQAYNKLYNEGKCEMENYLQNNKGVTIIEKSNSYYRCVTSKTYEASRVTPHAIA